VFTTFLHLSQRMIVFLLQLGQANSTQFSWVSIFIPQLVQFMLKPPAGFNPSSIQLKPADTNNYEAIYLNIARIK
jgi:hypothetical protein